MADKKTIEQMLEHLVNGDQAKAEELFHEYVVEASREIYESLIESEMADDEDDEEVDEAADTEADEDDEEVEEADDFDFFGEADEEEEEEEDDMVREYVEKVAAPKGEDHKATSPVAGKNDMGGTTSNMVKGGTENGRTAPKAQQMSTGNKNVPGGKQGLEKAPAPKRGE
jgi:hypothetical protein